MLRICPRIVYNEFTMKQGLNIPLINICVGLIATVLVVYILIIGRTILLPLMTAIVIWYLIIRLTSAFSHIPFTQQRIPYGISLLIALIITFLVLYGFVTLVTNSIYGVIRDAPQYQAKLSELIQLINKYTGSKLNFNEMFKHINLTTLFSNAALTLTYITGNLTLIIIYIIFLLLEYKTFNQKIRIVCQNEKRFSLANTTIRQISREINVYMRVKTIMSLLTGISSYLVLIAFGIQYAQFWALIIFILNYIPTIGSIVAIALTLLAVSIQFTSIGLYILMAIFLIAIQFVIGNIIEPKFLGKNLNLSPLVILLALAFWGSIWGILGMLLCVPLMTIINIVLLRFENTRHFAVYFSADPESLRTE